MNRFLIAQNNLTCSGLSVYNKALEEISQGNLKIHCWIRYLFPQMKGLGKSKVAEFYGIKGRDEAIAYMKHPILKQRYLKSCEAILNSNKSIYDIFGNNTMRIRASLLLMNSVCDNYLIKLLLVKHCWL